MSGLKKIFTTETRLRRVNTELARLWRGTEKAEENTPVIRRDKRRSYVFSLLKQQKKYTRCSNWRKEEILEMSNTNQKQLKIKWRIL